MGKLLPSAMGTKQLERGGYQVRRPAGVSADQEVVGGTAEGNTYTRVSQRLCILARQLYSDLINDP